jgi:3-hydroxybutyryl-CoA dehydrogenase
MQRMEVRRLGVVGAGTMGVGVAHTFAAAGLPVVLVDTSSVALERARAAIADNLRLYAMFDPGRTGEASATVLARISFTTSVTALASVDFVIENVTEAWAAKENLYRELDAVCAASCVLGVNTSAIPISALAALTRRPDRVIGTHFMNPAPLKPTVEVIRGFHTGADTVRGTRDLLRRAGKSSIVVADSSGFVTNRVAMLAVNEAILLVSEGVSNPSDIDRLFRQCFGHPMGPLETADLIGLDTVLLSLEVLLDNFDNPKFRPAPLLRALVDAGRLGRKSGHGFYDYSERTDSREKTGAP